MRLLLTLVVGVGLAAQAAPTPPATLPAAAVSSLGRSLAATTPHPNHVWRDTDPVNADGTVNAFVEIPRGDRQKWEFDMASNARRVDRVMPEDPGGYPVNYGFLPQTISYDGDPFDVLVLGPPLAGGALVRGQIVGLLQMEDEKGLDSKVVISPAGTDGRAGPSLTAADRTRIATYFARYKQHQPGAFSKVPGWGSVEDGRAYVDRTHEFFSRCRSRAGDCTIGVP